MLAFFPKIYKDELLISILKRYHVQTANVRNGYSLIELFNTHITTVHTYIPTNLNILSSNIPIEFNIKADDLIENNTLYNYYTAFLTKERKNEIRERMKQDRGNAFKITKYEDIPLNQYLRYCPKCINEQIEITGEMTWSRLHQVAYICPKHKEFILDSSYKTGGKDLNYVTPNGNIICINNRKEDKEMLLKISERIEEIVVNSSSFTHHDLRIVYHQELDKRGYLYKTKAQVYSQELEEIIQAYFGKELLIKILKREESRWISRLVHNYTKETHPLYHILMQEFLDLDTLKIGEILKDIEEFKKELQDKGFNTEGMEPWVYDYIEELSTLDITCKNVLAKHYGEKLIKDIRLHYCYSSQAFMCTFKCSCGFKYTTLYLDVLDTKGEKVGKIKEWGEVYFAELVKLEHLGIKKIARMTGINAGTIRRQRKGLRSVRRDKGLGDNSCELDNFGELGKDRGKGQEKDLGTQQEIGKMKKHKQSWRVEEWRKKDELYYEKVKVLLSQEQSPDQKPIWITKTYIGKQVRSYSAIMYNLDRMPRTKEIIEQNVMSREKWKVALMRYNSDIKNR
ncbi:MAG TPA: hypothetical protein GX707_13745 [Epulopiscium sp.]|nr:hypothetical protein [Candidatus Epulonipiscium sp.]